MLSIRLLATVLLALVIAAPVAAQVPGAGSVAFSDNFDDVSRVNFPFASTHPDERSQRYVDGEYEIVRRAGGSYSEFVPGVYTNSTIAVDVRLSDGPENARALLTCRRDTNAGYLFNVLPGRAETSAVLNNPSFAGPRFQLLKLQNGFELTLLDQGPAPGIRDKGEVNRLELTCAESTITGSINGAEVFSVLDSTWLSGRHGFGVAGVQTKGRFDNLVVTMR